MPTEEKSEEEKINEEVDAKFNKWILYIGGFGFLSALVLCLYLEMSLTYALGMPVIFGLTWALAKVKDG